MKAIAFHLIIFGQESHAFATITTSDDSTLYGFTCYLVVMSDDSSFGSMFGANYWYVL